MKNYENIGGWWGGGGSNTSIIKCISANTQFCPVECMRPNEGVAQMKNSSQGAFWNLV